MTRKKRGSKASPRTNSSKERPLNEPEPEPKTRSRPAGEIASTIKLETKDGHVIVAGDGHYIPGEPRSTAHRALVRFVKELAPRHLIWNGDALDASVISRHQRIGWEVRPALKDELEVCQERMGELELAAPKGCSKSWTVGNHDQLRFDSRLSALCPEYFGIHGFALADHFPVWNFAWAVEINDDITVKHRWKGGIHAPYNNCVNSGRTIVTGHLHSAKVIPYTDYSGTRYGVDHGCIADTKSRAFRNYTEASPLNWRSGFCVLSFIQGRLLMPELCLVVDEDRGLVQWRGQIVKL